MSERVFLCSVDALTDGEPKKIEVAGFEPLAVVAVDGRYYALSDECSHGAASLSEGWVQDDVIICPMHSGGFTLASGEPALPPCFDPVNRYEVVRDGEGLYLKP
jgi:ethylbenzene dioxygenase ferredoxin component